MVTLLVMLAVAPVNANGLAQRAFERSQRGAVRQQRSATLTGKVKALTMPMPASVRVAPSSEMPGMTSYAGADPASGTIYEDGPLDPFTLAHETAHLLEKSMTDADRRRFAVAMGRPKAKWDVGQSAAFGDSAATQGYRGSLSERFADMAAMIALDRIPGQGQVDSMYLDRQPTRRRLLRVGRALERFGARNGMRPYKAPSQPG